MKRVWPEGVVVMVETVLMVQRETRERLVSYHHQDHQVYPDSPDAMARRVIVDLLALKESRAHRVSEVGFFNN